MYTIERLQEITSQPVETPHEKWFQDTYSHMIANALEKLKNPPNPNHPRASWHPFKQVMTVQSSCVWCIVSVIVCFPKEGSWLKRSPVTLQANSTCGLVVVICTRFRVFLYHVGPQKLHDSSELLFLHKPCCVSFDNIFICFIFC